MEPSTIENKLLTPSVCRCCLTDECYKDLSTEYFWMGKREVYAEMLLEALNITLSYDNISCMICEQCITRLRDASAFKQQVIQSAKTFKDQLIIEISEITPTLDPLEDLKKEKDDNEEDKSIFDIAPDDNDDDYDDVDDQPLTNFTSNNPKNNTSTIIKSGTQSKLPVKRPNTSTLIPPPIKRIKIPEMIKETTKPLPTVKRIIAKVPSGKTQIRKLPLGMLDKKAMNQQIVSKLKRIGLMQTGSNKSLGSQLPRVMVKQQSAASKGAVKTLHVGGKIVVKKQIGYPTTKPSTSVPRVILKPKKENELNITRQARARINAELVIKYSTTYPFKLPEENMMCVYCGHIVDVPSKYRKHMETNHPEVKLKRRSFLNVESGNVKVDISDLRCRICSEAFESLDSVAVHLRDVHNRALNLSCELGLQPYKFIGDLLRCTVCDQKFHTMRSLSRHTQSHFSRYPCETCGKLYSSNCNLKKHVARSHSSKDISCVKCKKKFESHDARRQHLEESMFCRQYICNFCGDKFASWLAKQNHLAKVHKDAQTPHSCPECGESFEDKVKLRNHFHSIHNKNNSCQVCGKGFRDQRHLRNHMLVHTKEKKFQCTVCEKFFSRPNVLNQHMVIHCEERKFVCKVCGKKFNQRVTWKTHMNSYHPELTDIAVANSR